MAPMASRAAKATKTRRAFGPSFAQCSRSSSSILVFYHKKGMARPTPTCLHGKPRCLLRCLNCGHPCYQHYTNGCHGGTELEEPCYCTEFEDTKDAK